jgi:hypothetical protein
MRAIGIDEALQEFRRKAPSLVGVSDHKGLQVLFSSLMAAVRLGNQENEAAGRAAMEAELRQALLAPSNGVRRGLFDDV